MKKSPSGQTAAADAAPGQEGLFEYRRRWNTLKILGQARINVFDDKTVAFGQRE